MTATPDATPPPTLRLGPTRRRIQVPWVVLGVLLIAGSALAFGVIAQGLSRRSPVVSLARPVARGAVIVPADLAVARVAVDATVPLVDAADADTLLGRTAVAALPAGTLAVPELFVPGGTVADEESRVVGMALAPGAYPTVDLAAGDLVTAVSTEGGGSVLAPRAAVAATVPLDDGVGTTMVSVIVADDDAPAVAAAAAGNAVRLVLHGERR